MALDQIPSFRNERAALAAVFSTVKSNLRIVFISFLIGFLSSFYMLQLYVWNWMITVTESQMDPATAAGHEIIVQTPFDVILLQAKVGVIVGVLSTLVPSLYLARHELRLRGYWPKMPIEPEKLAALGIASALLFAGGVTYASVVFFPVLLDFLASNTLSAGVSPTWSIVMWTEFLLVLSVSFGLAAQLPLVMSMLAYTGIVPYETFRDRWRYAVLGIFIFGAVFSPPDPFSQFMWAVPLTILYGLSLALTRLLVGPSRSDHSTESEQSDADHALRTLRKLDSDGIQAAPAALFDTLSEPEAVSIAQQAIHRGDEEAAQAVLDRFDARSHHRHLPDASIGRSIEPGVGFVGFEGLREFAIDVREDDDIGGYAYDAYAVASALRVKARRIVLVFGAVLLATFGILYEGGFGLLRAQFFSRVPSAAQLEGSELVALHPVEVLLFQMEVSTIVAVITVAPLLAYYAWPTLRERELVHGHHTTILVWMGTLGATFVTATFVGYLYVAPPLLSYLVSDALRAGLVVSYRIDRVAWLVVYTTVGLGVLACIPTGMWLLNRSSSIPYRSYREKWREITILVLVLSSLFSPGVLPMLLAAISTMIAYGVGLLGLWILTLGGRRGQI